MALDQDVRVLIVDADPGLRRQLRTRLLNHDVDSDCVADSKEAVQNLRARMYAVVLVDIHLPRGGAEEVLRTIGSLDVGRRPVVLVVSTGAVACSLDVDVVQVVLRKPLDLTQLSDIVESCVRASSAPRREPEGALPPPSPEPNGNAPVRERAV